MINWKKSFWFIPLFVLSLLGAISSCGDDPSTGSGQDDDSTSSADDDTGDSDDDSGGGTDDASDDDTVAVCTVEEFCTYEDGCMAARYDWFTESICLDDRWWEMEAEDAPCPYVKYLNCLCECMSLDCSDYDNLQDLCRMNCEWEICADDPPDPT
jgi:hypothetical protein